MIKKLSGNMVDWQIQRGILTEKERELYAYGYELLTAQVVSIFLTGLIALLFQSVLGFVFMLFYYPLRTYAGGLHARSNERCMLTSCIILCGVCIFTKYVFWQDTLAYVVVAEAVAILCIFKLAPVEDRKKRLEEDEKERYKKCTYRIMMVELVAAFIFFAVGKYEVSQTIFISHIILAVFMILGWRKEKS